LAASFLLCCVAQAPASETALPHNAQPLVSDFAAPTIVVELEPQPQPQTGLKTETPLEAKGLEADPQYGQDKKPPTPPHTGVRALLDGLRLDIKNLPSKPNLYLALTGGGAAIAVHPFDQTFNIRLRSHYDAVNTFFAPGKYAGGTAEQLALSLGTYAFGRAFDEPKVSHLGMDLLRAQIMAELLVEPLKLATHRQRPDGSNSQSFPSGHAAATFAAATVIGRHLGWKKAALVYGVASYVAASRLHDNVHYLSDVVFGAALGTIAGRTVTEHGREVWSNAWSVAPAFVPGGVAFVVVHTP
jgi:membrane-associated phospholipid phosphatase